MLTVWFPWIATKGIPWILASPEVVYAVNPANAVSFLWSFPSLGALIVIGVAVLAITGGEAKYADIGHFSIAENVREGESCAQNQSGRKPVMQSWFFVVLPSLLLCCAGQCGYLLEKGVPDRANTFYAITPKTGVDLIDQTITILDMIIAAIAAK